MDERQLKNLLNRDVPSPDENVRKRVINLALAEFSAAKNDPKKSFQGFGVWSRLTGRINQTPKEGKMNKKLVYGGMATAMVAILAVAATLPQMQNGIISASSINAGLSPTLKEAPGGKMAQVYERALKDVNEANVERAIKEGSSSLPVPIGPSRGKVESELEKKQVYAAADAAKPVPAEKREAESVALGAMTTNVAMPAAPVIAMQSDVMTQPGYHDVGRDKFEKVDENTVKLVKETPVSTFSADVDTASYTFVRKQLNAGVLPQKDAVRVEEMINYFDYKYALPADKTEPFKPTVTVVPSPWMEGHKLVHIAIKGYDIPSTQKPHSNLVFLIDTSGSMNEPDKLPLLKSSLKMLLDTLSPDDTVGIVTYAGSAGIALEPTKVSDKAKIISALDSLGAGGGTAGAEGIRTAYQLAENTMNSNRDAEKAQSPTYDGPVLPKSINRVILATDGDFNIGITDHNELKGFIERERASGIFLSVLGFGTGNYNDQMMQDLAQNGNGVAAYIDTLNEARKVLVQEASSTLFTIAKDVKIQVEFNPAKVSEYRLVGYETRALNREDFNNDKVDAGDIGSGHAVTAIYDITPAGAQPSVDPSRYAAGSQNCHEVRVHATDDKNSPLMAKTVCDAPVQETKADTKNLGNEYGFLKIRYKLPDGDTSKLITTPISSSDEKPLADTKCPPDAKCLVADSFGASDDVRFSVAVAGFGQLLKGSKYTGKLTYDDVIDEAQNAKGADEFGYRAEFINLIRLAKSVPALPDNQQ